MADESGAVPDDEASAGRRDDPLPVTVTAIGPVTVVCPTGEIDHHSGYRLREALDLPAGRPPRIVLDLSQVTFMDSSGINIVLTTHRTLEAAGGWIRLAGCEDIVLRTVQLVGLDTIIGCYASRDLALRA